MATRNGVEAGDSIPTHLGPLSRRVECFLLQQLCDGWLADVLQEGVLDLILDQAGRCVALLIKTLQRDNWEKQHSYCNKSWSCLMNHTISILLWKLAFKVEIHKCQVIKLNSKKYGFCKLLNLFGQENTQTAHSLGSWINFHCHKRRALDITLPVLLPMYQNHRTRRYGPTRALYNPGSTCFNTPTWSIITRVLWGWDTSGQGIHFSIIALTSDVTFSKMDKCQNSTMVCRHHSFVHLAFCDIPGAFLPRYRSLPSQVMLIKRWATLGTWYLNSQKHPKALMQHL